MVASWKPTRGVVAVVLALLGAAGPAPGATSGPWRAELEGLEGPRVTVAGPLGGAKPGVVRLHGAVHGERPLTVRVDDREATAAGGTWSIELELGVGEHRNHSRGIRLAGAGGRLGRPERRPRQRANAD